MTDPWVQASKNLELVVRASWDDANEALAFIGVEGVNEVRRMVTNPSPSQPGQPPGLITGGLRLSYKWEYRDRRGRFRSIAIGSDRATLQPTTGRPVTYACVFGKNTSVPTADGVKAICQVREGDRVLTATGEWREVLKATKFPVAEKPDLVTLRAPWRSGKDHVITLTADHKVAIEREGRVLWVPAGSIQPGRDRIFRRRKQAHNKKVWEPLVCQRCSVELPNPSDNRTRRFCYPCAKESTAAWHRGRKRPATARARMAAAARASGRNINHLASVARGQGTNVEEQVAAWLDGRGVHYERNMVFGRHYVDFWVPETNEIYEADGAYWHRDQAKDVRRDAVLAALIPGVRITHLHFFDPRWTPPLDPNPLPNVRYEVVNPSAESFVEPDAFEAVDVTAEPWTWQSKGGPTPALYDLAVEGVHSFVASGLLVSNSFLEFGTRQMEPRPHFRPAMLNVRQRMPAHFARAITNAQRRQAARLRAVPGNR